MNRSPSIDVERCDGARFTPTALAAIVFLSAASTHAARGQSRCVLLGPLVVSSYVAVIQHAAARHGTEAAKQAASTSALLDLYERLGCSMPALTSALECVSQALADPKADKPVTEIAETCMHEATMPVR